jgi:bacillithiol system protein YtxJ
MPGWLERFRPTPLSIPEVTSNTDLEELLQHEAVILFKHSSACPVSWAAHAHVMRFVKAHQSVPVYLVHVLKERATSRSIADRTGVRHESPQIIFVRNGVAAESASHGAITESLLAGMLAQCR